MSLILPLLPHTTQPRACNRPRSLGTFCTRHYRNCEWSTCVEFTCENGNTNWTERQNALAPQSHGVVPAAGCQKRRRRVKRHRSNFTAVPLQSRHTSRRRVVGGQQPQSHGMVAAAGCQKRRRRVKRHRVNMVHEPLHGRHTSRRRVVGGQQPQSHGVIVAASRQKRRRRMKRHRVNRAAVLLQSRHTRRRRVVGGLPPWSQLP